MGRRKVVMPTAGLARSIGPHAAALVDLVQDTPPDSQKLLLQMLHVLTGATLAIPVLYKGAVLVVHCYHHYPCHRRCHHHRHCHCHGHYHYHCHNINSCGHAVGSIFWRAKQQTHWHSKDAV